MKRFTTPPVGHPSKGGELVKKLPPNTKHPTPKKTAPKKPPIKFCKMTKILSNSTRKRILVFIDWYLPGYKAGGPVRSVANMLQHLSDKYDFYVVTRNTDYLETEPYPNIEANKWLKISDNQQIMYLSATYVNIRKITNIIKQTEFDTIYINGIYSFYFSILPLFVANRKGKAKIVVAPRGMLSPNSINIKTLRKKMFLSAMRIVGFYKNVIFHFSTRQEAEYAEVLNLRQKRNFVAINLPKNDKIQTISKIEKRVGELFLVSIARISPEKNTMYAIECLSQFKYEGKIRFDLYGAIYDDNYWKNCKKLIAKLPTNIEVNYKGTVDNSLINNVLQEYHFLFLPSRGENFGHSIVESLRCSVPVIISDKTAWQKLSEASAGWDIELSRKKDFAKAIKRALELDNQQYSAMKRNALNYITSHFNIDKILPLYYELFD